MAGRPTLKSVRDAARTCRRCPLYRNATQTIFGEGPATATVMLVGEQPGDQEDMQGRPFVGPAGKLLDRALAVKHFKFEPRGKKRIHKKPAMGEIEACRWWLVRNLACYARI